MPKYASVRLQQDVNHVKAELSAPLELHVDPHRVRPCAQLAGRCFVVLVPELHKAEIIPRAVVRDPFFKDPPGDRCELPVDPIGIRFLCRLHGLIHWTLAMRTAAASAASRWSVP